MNLRQWFMFSLHYGDFWAVRGHLTDPGPYSNNKGHSSCRTEISLCPFLRRREVLTLCQKERKKNLVKKGDWEKETFCSAKIKTLYLLQTMVAIRRLQCRLPSQGNLGFFAYNCTKCALRGPVCSNQTWYSWRMVSVCSVTWSPWAGAPCQDSSANRSSCAPANLREKAEALSSLSFSPHLRKLKTWGFNKVLAALCQSYKKKVNLKPLDTKLRSHQDNEGRIEVLLFSVGGS